MAIATGSSIEAVLTLNTSGFKTGIGSAISELEKFTSRVNSFNTDTHKMESAIRSLFSNLELLNRELVEFNASITNLNKFSQLSTAINKMANGLKILSSETVDVEQGINTMNNIFKAWGTTLNGTEIKVKGVTLATEQLSNSERELANTERQVASASNQESASVEKDAVAKDKATTSTQRYDNANKSLSKTFGMLRNAITLVGSMIAYNFVHHLATATNETINAKSEMNGYFHLLGYTKSTVDGFNKALDDTVKKFPRLNKYALGETISSIGVEFELTTAEMKKAMPVVSMITSEYLRAGRNVNEASLAVKDILQGEFQRLSRETGVKGDQLKATGLWSGDKSDVMGLLKALDKVGKDRNWDVFVTKANSLNDAVLIMQNRFGEFSADLVERFQPSILKVFNTVMVVASDFGRAINKVLDWMSGDGLGQSIVKWGGLATAVIGVSSAFIHLRTGANLLQIAQMGLSGTIGATILGLEAETVAEYGLRTSIIATCTGLDAETVKRQGRLKTIFSSITGLDAEALSLKALNRESLLTIGYVGAMVGVFALFTGALIVQAMQISETTEKYSKFVNMLDKGDEIISDAKDSVDVLTNKEKYLTEKLGELTEGSYEYKKIANELSVVQGDLTIATQNYSDAVNSVAWVKHKQELYDEEKASAQADAQKEINQALLDYGFNVTEASQLSSQYWNDAINGWDQHYETLQKVNLQYEKNAKSVQSALKQLNDTKLEDKEVQVLIRRKISSGNKIADIKEDLGNAESLTEYVDKWAWLQVAQIENALVDWDINSVSGGLSQAIDGVAKGIVHFLADNMFGKMGRALADYLGLTGTGDQSVVKDSGLLETFEEYLTQMFSQLFLNINLDSIIDLGGVFGSIGDYFHSHSLMEIFGLDESHDYNEDIDNWIDNTIVKPITEFDWVGHLTDAFTIAFSGFSLLGALWDAILPQGVSASDGSSDHPSFMEDVSAILGFDVQSWIDSFNADPLGTLGISLPNIDIIGMIKSLIPTDGGGFDLGQWLKDTFNVDGIIDYFTSNLPSIVTTTTTTASAVMGKFGELKDGVHNHLTGVVTNVSTGFENAKNYAKSKMDTMYSGVKGVIDQMTGAWRTMKDSILDSAKLIYDGVKAKFDSVKTTLSDFFSKLQNPSQWGAGQKSMSRSPKPYTARRLFSGAGMPSRRSGAGINPYSSPNQKVKLADLIDIVGDNKEVTLSDFLSLFTEGGFGSWSFHEPSKKRIFDVGKTWKTAPPNIQGIGSVGSGYQVGRFWNGKPSFSFDEFLQVAEAIFSAIPYKFYYDSEWKGNWVSALLSGAVNCSDGADALLPLASVFGFSGEKVHTNLSNGTGHFYTRINGRNLDTTHFQNSGSWSPLGGAGTPPRSYRSGNTTNINIEITGNIYGIDNFKEELREASREVMREEFNDPYTIAL